MLEDDIETIENNANGAPTDRVIEAWSRIKEALESAKQTDNIKSVPCKHEFITHGESVKCVKCNVCFPMHQY